MSRNPYHLRYHFSLSRAPYLLRIGESIPTDAATQRYENKPLRPFVVRQLIFRSIHVATQL